MRGEGNVESPFELPDEDSSDPLEAGPSSRSSRFRRVSKGKGVQRDSPPPIPIPAPCGLLLVPFVDVCPSILDSAPSPFSDDSPFSPEKWIDQQGEEFVKDVEAMAEDFC